MKALLTDPDFLPLIKKKGGGGGVGVGEACKIGFSPLLQRKGIFVGFKGV